MTTTKLNPLTVLRQAQRELYDIPYLDFVQSKDKVLMLFDLARNALSPAEERAASPERHQEAVTAVNEAIRALARTIHGNAHMTEEETYAFLSRYGKTTVPADRLYWIFDETIKRLMKPTG